MIWTIFSVKCFYGLFMSGLVRISPPTRIHLLAFYRPMKSLIPLILSVMGWSGMLGATMTFSLASDLLNIMTFHIYIFYNVAARIYHWLNILWSLFNLFRGKKFNVLRNRLDSCDYDLDQLLLGTILFTLLFFLFPTVVVYCVLFCGARLIVILLQVGLKTCLVVLNHFPLFALMLKCNPLCNCVGSSDISINAMQLHPNSNSF
jgi:phosphatidylinositol glycan class Q protein